MFAKSHCAHDEDICSGLSLASFQPWGVKGAFPISRPSWPLLHPHRPALGQQTGKTGHNRCPPRGEVRYLAAEPVAYARPLTSIQDSGERSRREPLEDAAPFSNR